MKLGVRQYVQSFFYFCDLSFDLFLAILKIRLLPYELTVVVILAKFLWEVYLIRLHHILHGFWNLPTFQGHRRQS
jgi:hypothetical protein